MNATNEAWQLRADARQSIARIVAAATSAFIDEKTDVSLEEVARRAKVGSATLHRHFPSRTALLETVFREQVHQLCLSAQVRSERPGDDLVNWLRQVARFIASSRGIASSLLRDVSANSGDPGSSACRARIEQAAEPLVLRAQAEGSIRDDVTVADLLDVANALASVPGHDESQSDRLVTLAFDGVRGR